MPRVDALPTVLLENVFALLCHEELLAVERVCVAFRATIFAGDLWKQRVCGAIIFSADDAPAHALGWKRLACMLEKPCDEKSQLLDDVVACSSVHRPVETPSNTLTPSRCWTTLSKLSPNVDPTHSYTQHGGGWHHSLGRLAQLQCGCFRGPACYWSSTPSLDKNTTDLIDYSVHAGSLLRALQVVPYRAFWHPHNPTYGPAAVSISIYRRPKPQIAGDKQHGEPLYQSGVVPLENDMKLQQCALPVPVWLPDGAVLRLHLLGRHQVEPFELRGIVPDNEGDYYTAISYVAAVGVRVSPTPP